MQGKENNWTERVNQTNAVMLVSIEFSSLAAAHHHISWKLYKLPQKDNCKPIKHWALMCSENKFNGETHNILPIPEFFEITQKQ